MESLRLVPLDRLLLETDHPFGDRSESQPRRPGNLSHPESAVSAAFSISPDVLRCQTWRNLKTIAEKLNLVEMFPGTSKSSFSPSERRSDGHRLLPACHRSRSLVSD
jgi:hypothetical protein